MTTKQAREACAALGVNPDDAVGGEPRYIAFLRAFDADSAERALDDHNEAAQPRKPEIKQRGKETKSLVTADGGAK